MLKKKNQFIILAILTAVLSLAANAQSGNPRVKSDFDGDGKSDIGVFRNGEWFILPSSGGGYIYDSFGGSGNPVHADYDGDGKTDLAVWRCVGAQGTFFIRRSSDGRAITQPWGKCPGDYAETLTGDYDGDGKADITVFRTDDGNGTRTAFYILRSSDGQMQVIQWGASGDFPRVADYDGDGKTDAAVYRSSANSFYVLRSSDNQLTTVRFGVIGFDSPFAADFDGDKKAEFVVYRFLALGANQDQGTWYFWNNATQRFSSVKFGKDGSDWAVPADYDGDGKADVAVWRQYEGYWYVMKSSGGYIILKWGSQNDIPLTR